MDRGREISAMLLNPDIYGPKPESVPCPFCGRALSYEAYRDTSGNLICWSMMPKPCTCAGYVQEMERQAEERRREERRETQRRQHQLYDCLINATLYGTGITRERMRCSLDAYAPRNGAQCAALDSIRRYVLEYDDMLASGTGLVLSGPNGTGKTHLGIGCVVALQHAGYYGIMFRTALEIQRELKSAWDRHISETDIMRAYLTLPLLVIDDLGKQTGTDYMHHCLYEIFDGRYSRRLPTILTTNLAPSALAAGISADPDLANAVVSRLMETMICIPVTGNDYRRHLSAMRRGNPLEIRNIRNAAV